jgi:hypothetical protein
MNGQKPRWRAEAALLLAWVLLSVACREAPRRPLQPAFFWWQTAFEPSAAAYRLSDTLGCRKWYVKVFDIGRVGGGEIAPYARTEVPDSALRPGLELTPTLFITHESLRDISEQKLRQLADNIAAATPPAREWLLDCDWTPSTRAAFFQLIRLLRARRPAGTLLSATIRLHQYKFPDQTGVPPADRGMLMFYNTGELDEEMPRNTVFHPADALRYLDGAPDHYPLPLDLALPLFSWGLVYREGELWKIIPGPLPLDSMRQSGHYRLLPPEDSLPAELWELQSGTFLGGHYLRPGDRLRHSAVSPEHLLRIARLAGRLDLAEDACVAFFHLGVAQSEGFRAEYLQQALDAVAAEREKR